MSFSQSVAIPSINVDTEPIESITIATLFKKGTESTVHIPAGIGALSCFYICSDGKIAKFRSRAMLQDGLTTKALATNCCLPEELELNHIFNEKYSVSAKVSYTGYLIGKAQNVLIKGCNTKK